jgi:hypothetical protein
MEQVKGRIGRRKGIEMLAVTTTFGYLPLCTPEKGSPWFAGNVTIGYTASDARVAFTKACTGNPSYETRDWDALKKEGWRIVRVKISEA